MRRSRGLRGQLGAVPERSVDQHRPPASGLARWGGGLNPRPLACIRRWADPRCLTALHVGVALMSTLASQFLLPPKNPKSPRASRRASPASTGRISGLRNFWRVRAHVLSRFRRAKTRKLGSSGLLVGGCAERHGACFGCARVAICGLEAN